MEKGTVRKNQKTGAPKCRLAGKFYQTLHQKEVENTPCILHHGRWRDFGDAADRGTNGRT